jgi:sulfur carrier protein
MALHVTLNGQPQDFPELHPGATLAQLLVHLKLKPDRVAVERNCEIAPRSQWPEIALLDGDKLEVVHFVGGGL